MRTGRVFTKRSRKSLADVDLKKRYEIQRLAADLGLRASEDPVGGIIAFCNKRLRGFLDEFPECGSLSELLGIAAQKIGTLFEEIRREEALQAVKSKYVEKGEKAFADLEGELSDDVFGMTFRRMNRKTWEPEFVSVIDCRGIKSHREYYTKWHELAHLFVLTNQYRLQFRRTHCGTGPGDPEERLVDVVAGELGFYAPLIQQHVNGEISFEAIESARERLCAEASRQSALIGMVKAWPGPCVLVKGEMALKKDEERAEGQLTFGFSAEPTPKLRAVRFTLNKDARARGIKLFRNLRIPERSVIHRVFAGADEYGEGTEDLSIWESSDGIRLPRCAVRVKARKAWDGVEALIIPLQ